eukprot:g54050.t1
MRLAFLFGAQYALCVLLAAATTTAQLETSSRSPALRRMVLNNNDGCVSEDGHLCQFPFKYGSSWQWNCITDNNNGEPWCATKLESNGMVATRANCDTRTCFYKNDADSNNNYNNNNNNYNNNNNRWWGKEGKDGDDKGKDWDDSSMDMNGGKDWNGKGRPVSVVK